MDDQIITPILGDPESADPGLIAGTSHLQASCLRRLFFECYTATMSHFKRKAEATDHTEPRKLSRAEKAHFCARFDAHGMTGFKSRGKLDPSDHYLERLAHLMETDDFDFKVMEWEKVTIQPAPLVKVSDTAKSASGFWRETSRLVPEAPVTNSLVQAYQLLHRRGIAWDMISFCPFSDHEKLVEFCWDKLDREPPPDYARVSLEQVRTADFEIMKEVQRHVRSSGLRRSAEGTFPIGVALAAAMLDPTVNALLAHLSRRAPPVKGAPDSRPEACKQDRSPSPARSPK